MTFAIIILLPCYLVKSAVCCFYFLGIDTMKNMEFRYFKDNVSLANLRKLELLQIIHTQTEGWIPYANTARLKPVDYSAYTVN